MSTRSPSRLRSLPLGARLGLSGVVLTLALGLWASLEHLAAHHEKRDGESGVSLTDLRGAYHGLDDPAPLLVALEGGHPESLGAGERELLETWLRGGKVSEQYDDLDLGESAPAEVLADACLDCHGRESAVESGRGLSLETWDDVKSVAFARSLEATPREILLVSTHTHALALGTLTLALAFLVLATGFPSWLKSALIGAAGIALFLDLACWWLAREQAGFVLVLAAAGAVYAAATAASAGLVLLDMWMPARTKLESAT